MSCHSPRTWIYSKHCEENLFFACQRYTTEYPFIMEMMTWSQAEEYCNNGYNGLASFAMSQMSFFSKQNFPIWIGLHRNGGSWKWSLGLEEDKHWNLSNPSKDTTCVTISSEEKELATKNCQTQLPFLCTKDNMVLVKENKSWEEVFEHCRGLRSSSTSKIHFNLLSVKPGDEHTYVMNKVKEADTEEVQVPIPHATQTIRH
ncbi:C-type mannose receptor 2-like isoform X3 [Girardinichthys multiradiatus]|uniref:C-type mannose receptor 2-like isoform X3 n=1 Tax=Girardinichthys multiradiatus TaxID=208333 RepID=UPI001FACE265|nr:C-type mannose receptor 2-like isoform X3 [Girardinichthys multiradiatus]